ncbi:hypothetical protein ACFOKF_18900 [Sphingobium rhizovicinum]|uniref:Uncharacterized protein n=1 Tax=Sphingobium rhizovicinum TaxID=432308 RepID=A0ABV7NM45_9SPHN
MSAIQTCPSILRSAAKGATRSGRRIERAAPALVGAALAQGE